jgi:uncharacterized protein YuzE
MKVKYFKDTDTLYIEFRDLDDEGNVCAITFEHASARTDVQQVTLEGIAA